VIITGDHDHVRVGRSPRPHHHHHHHHSGYSKVAVSGDNDHVRVDCYFTASTWSALNIVLNLRSGGLAISTPFMNIHNDDSTG
jgi:hypothetical protein